MKLLKMTAALVACTQASLSTSHTPKHNEMEDKEMRLSQAFATSFNMRPPKLMPKNPAAGNGDCPVDGKKIKKLTFKESGGAFLDGCYMNTTR